MMQIWNDPDVIIALTFLVMAVGFIAAVLSMVWALCVMAKRQHQEMDKYEVTVAAKTVWNREPPAHQRTVEIYHNWTVCKAYYDGSIWRNPATREAVAVVACWHPQAQLANLENRQS